MKNKDNMEILHELLVEELIRKVKSGEANASDLNVIRQLLKDNGVDSDASNPANPITNLIEDLPFKQDYGQ